MKPNSYTRVAVLASLALVTCFASIAQAQTPNANGIKYHLRLFNDCPASTVTTSGTYPSIAIQDSVLPCVGFANLHLWKFSEDGGATEATFHNNSEFSFCADLKLEALDTNGAEAGISISPWYADDAGRFNVRVFDGEVAVFGGRLPFYSFTGSNGVVYVAGTTIRLEMIYHPNGLSMASPATVTYNVTYNSLSYSSGPLAFDEGNTSEDPPHGLWGILDPAKVGGYLQPRLDPGNFASYAKASFSNICYNSLATPTAPSSWGRLKTLYR